MPIAIRPITVAQFFDAPNCDALLAEYAAESATEGLPAPEPHRAIYEAMEQSGMFHLIGAFEGDELAGFLVLLVSVNPHYSAVIAVTESYFVASAHRKAGAGLALLHEAEALAAKLGAVGFLVSAPSGGRLAEVLPRMGYRETNRVFFRATDR
jgi:GNAT superfamily N-acetyltransferase